MQIKHRFAQRSKVRARYRERGRGLRASDGYGE
jgi:hypothetical protein